MKKKFRGALLAGMLSLSMVVTQMSGGSIPSQAAVVKTAEDSNGIWGVYRILNEGQERPKSFDEFLSKSWSFAGRGYIYTRETVCGDVDIATGMVKVKSEEVKEIEANLEEDEKLEWFAARQQGNLWYVYGQVCEKTESTGDVTTPTVEATAVPTVEPTMEPTATPTATPTVKPTTIPTAVPTVQPTATAVTLTDATFKVLNREQSIPMYSDLYVWCNWTTVGTGKIIETEEITNNEDLVEACVADVPAAAQELLEDGEEIRWFSTKKMGNWFVYGKICKVGEETDAYIDTNTITDYSNCYFTRYYILQYGQEQPTSLEQIDQLKWDYAQTGYATKQRRIMGYENVEPLLAKIPASSGLEIDEDVHWIAMTASTNQCKVYGVIYNVNVEESRENGAVESDETEVTVDTLEDAKALNAIYKDGTIIKTRGYYKAGDGGAATYEIANHGNGKTFSTFITATGQHVNLIVEKHRIDLRQLGAGVCEEIIYNTSDIQYNDDAARLSEAIALIDAYDGGEVYIPEGNYRCASKVSLGGDHYRIVGDGNTSILYTDNGYKGDEHFLTIVGKDITLDSIRVEAHETKWVPYYRQCSLLAASDINILNCEFSVQDNVISYDGNTDRQYTNITLYTGWHNVKIDNCLMEQMGCVERGACLGIIDMWSNGCSNVSVTNCVMRQNAHDEMLGIFTKTGADAAIENVYIANNKMYTASAPNVSRKTMAITIAYDESKQISNVRFVNNEVVADVPSNFMTFGALSDCVVENNKFTINHTVSYNAGVIFDTRKGVTVRNNDVKVTSPKGGGITQVFKQNGVFENNRINCDGYVYSIMYYGGKAIGNTIHIKGGCHAIAIDPEQIRDNTITVDGYMDNYIHYTKLNTDSTITNNTFNYLYNETEANYHPSTAGNVIYAGFHAGIDGYTVTFTENTINAPKVTTKNKVILLYGVGGSDEQKFIIKDNKVGVYKWIRNLYGQSLGGVQTDNNVDVDGNVIDYNANVTYFYNQVN